MVGSSDHGNEFFGLHTGRTELTLTFLRWTLELSAFVFALITVGLLMSCGRVRSCRIFLGTCCLDRQCCYSETTLQTHTVSSEIIIVSAAPRKISALFRWHSSLMCMQPARRPCIRVCVRVVWAGTSGGHVGRWARQCECIDQWMQLTADPRPIADSDARSPPLNE